MATATAAVIGCLTAVGSTGRCTNTHTPTHTRSHISIAINVTFTAAALLTAPPLPLRPVTCIAHLPFAKGSTTFGQHPMHEAQQGAEWLSVYAATADTLLLPSLFLACKKHFSLVYLPSHTAYCCYCCLLLLQQMFYVAVGFSARSHFI